MNGRCYLVLIVNPDFPFSSGSNETNRRSALHFVNRRDKTLKDGQKKRRVGGGGREGEED